VATGRAAPARSGSIEFTLQIVVRDTETGAITSDILSGLRMGANYASPRQMADEQQAPGSIADNAKRG
jgi:hypothetical protein